MTEITLPVAYTQAIAKGGALLTETRVLLAAWEPGEGEASLAERTLSEDLLGRATARRVKDIVRVFSLRYLQPDDAPARHLKRIAAIQRQRQMFNDLVLYYVAKRDALLRDFTMLRFWPLVRDGRLTIANSDVRDLILDAELDGRIPAPWSAEIKRDMAGRILITLTDLGLLRELKPARREVMPYSLTDETIIYLAYLLRSEGVTDASLAMQPAWALYGLEPTDVWNRLDALSGDDWFIVQRAGQIVRITWRYSGIEEVVGDLAG